jgi:DNA-binding NarL/FixJ family response regulator
MSPTTILLADDHGLTLDALFHLLREDFNVIATARDGRSVVELARKKRPEVIVMDIAMPCLNGIDAMRILQKENCSSRVLFLTRYADLPLVEEALHAGASGFVLKVCDPAEFVKAIQSVAKGTTYVTPLVGDLRSSLLKSDCNQPPSEIPLNVHQPKMVQLLTKGKSSKEAAITLRTSTKAAKSHRHQMTRL